ncbi:hypothetical protein D915_002804 [Fasciola hepatica]|uniref:Uncharacterized protein n=1 Tax=Fasciola hepatica TaxID=6192 RepID=A0A2H1CM68_FASHE|nr:hypothetical protein D915_002804 [Fasciola hepatica]
MAFLCIDLGYTHSSVVLCREDQSQLLLVSDPESHNPIISPHVTYGPNGWLVGARAEREQYTDPKNVVFGIKQLLTVPSVELSQKALNFPFELVKTEKDQTAVKLGYHVIQTNKFVQIMVHTFVQWAQNQFAVNQPIREVIFNVPHHFSPGQQDQFVACARDAGLERIHTVDDQTAIALVYQHERKSTEMIKVMFFNQGANSFHLSVFQFSNENMTELGTVDDKQTGGNEYDQRLLTHIMRKCVRKTDLAKLEDSALRHKILQFCRKAKHKLTTQTDTSIQLPNDLSEEQQPLSCSRQLFERLNADLFAYFRLMIDSLLTKSSVRRSEVGEVVLVGGATKIPKIYEIIREYFGNHIIVNDELRLAHIFACGGILKLARLKNLSQMELPRETEMDDTSLQGGCLTGSIVSQSDSLHLHEPIGFQIDGGVPITILQANTLLPAQKDWIYMTEFDFQLPSVVRIWQGDWPRRVAANDSLGTLRCPELPPLLKGTPVFRITFEIGDQGDLAVSIVDLCTTCESRLVIKQYVINRSQVSECVDHRRRYLEREVKTILRIMDTPIAEARMSKKNREEVKEMCNSTYSWLMSSEMKTLQKLEQRRQDLLDIWLDHVADLYSSTFSATNG